MSSYLNMNFLNFKFEFPGKNFTQSEKRIYEDFYVTIANQLFYLRNRKQNIFPVTTVFWGYVQTLFNLKREIY